MLQGTPVSEGIALGRAYLYRSYTAEVTPCRIEQTAAQAEWERLDLARKNAQTELEAVRERLSDAPGKAKIFTAHIDILNDVAVEEDLHACIEEESWNAENAVLRVYRKYIRILGASRDALIRERAADAQDVCTRLLRNLSGVKENSLSALPYPAVIVTRELLPSDTASMDREKVLAILTETGGTTSHTAIIARAFGIPAVLGVERATERIAEGEELIVDALTGSVYLSPDAQQVSEFSQKRVLWRKKVEETAFFLSAVPHTSDGVRIEMQLNIGSASAQEMANAPYADGVGLFRSEFLYMESDVLPEEAAQEAAYRRVLSTFQDRPVILRTLDIGGDKSLKSLPLPKEENPFLGNRALRLCFSRPELFGTQLRAALRASVEGNLWLMFPMVGGLDDLRRAKQAVTDAQEELRAQGIPFRENIPLGVMIEIPSAALIADLIANEADFASIGTNDLCQYTCAADRMNPEVAPYYQEFHPAMFRLIRFVADTFAKRGKPLGVCGEVGGDPLALPVLIGMGIKKVSTSPGALAACKKAAAAVTLEQARALCDAVCAMETAKEIRAYLQTQLAT